MSSSASGFGAGGYPPQSQFFQYGSVSQAPTGTGYAYPPGAQMYPGGQGPPQPGSPQRGMPGYMAMMQDGAASYGPASGRYPADTRAQFASTGGYPAPSQAGLPSPAGGSMMPPGPAGPYSEVYRMAAERDPANAKWYKKQEKEALKMEKQSAKKAKEWDRDQRAREEAEARQRTSEARADAERERIRRMKNPYERESRSSMGGGQGTLAQSSSVADLQGRLSTLSTNPYQTNSLGGRARRVSMSESFEAPLRMRRPSVSGIDAMLDPGTRSRRVSGSYGTGSATPASAVGAFYPDRERALANARERGSRDFDAAPGRSPGYPMPGTLSPMAMGYMAPDGSGRVLGPGGGQLVHQPSGAFPGHFPQQPGVGYPPSAAHGMDSRSMAPPSFYREPSRSVSYARFDPFAVLWDLNELRKFNPPPLPALLVPCDVGHEDWNRCIHDVAAAWTGTLPYNIFPGTRAKSRRSVTGSSLTPSSASRALVRPSSAVTKTIDIWNASFFYARKLELILYRGLERRSGMTAGKRSERLKSGLFPSQYRDALLGKGIHRRSLRAPSTDEDDTSDNSSLTSSSTSASSDTDSESASEGDPDESSDEDEPDFVTQHRERRGVGSHHIPQTPYPARGSRRNSLSAPSLNAYGAAPSPLDSHEMWVVKSREAVKMIRARQKVERKRRKLERRERRRELRGEPLYSLWIASTR